MIIRELEMADLYSYPDTPRSQEDQRVCSALLNKEDSGVGHSITNMVCLWSGHIFSCNYCWCTLLPSHNVVV